jgi:uncharacterized protein YjbJ (UPF0337 family)
MAWNDPNEAAGDEVPGAWNDVRDRVRERWPRLTTDDLDEIAGSRRRLVQRIQQRYGVAPDDAGMAVREFLGRGERGRSAQAAPGPGDVWRTARGSEGT